MRNAAWVKAVSVLMALITPLSLLAADNGAMLYPQGTVAVNGTSLARSQAIFNGDRIQTFKNSGASITATGSSVQIAPLSSVMFSDKALTVNNGGASIVTSNGLPAHLYNVSIEPVQKARYEFGERDGQVVIAAVEGALKISDGHQTMLVNPGKAFVAKLGPMPQNDQGRRKTPAGGAVPAAGVGITLSKGTLVEIAAAAAVIGAILVILLTRKNCPKNASPSSPAATTC